MPWPLRLVILVRWIIKIRIVALECKLHFIHIMKLIIRL